MSDYTWYYHNESDDYPLIRPENEQAQREFEENVEEYWPFLYRWYNHDGSHEWFKTRDDGYFLKPGRDCNDLVKHLVKKGFKLALNDNRQNQSNKEATKP